MMNNTITKYVVYDNNKKKYLSDINTRSIFMKLSDNIFDAITYDNLNKVQEMFQYYGLHIMEELQIKKVTINVTDIDNN